MREMSNMRQGSLIVLLAGSFGLPAVADQEIKQSLDAAADGYVRVYNTAGTIEISGWSRNSVEVEAYLGDDVQELIFERNGDVVLIKVKVPNRHHGDIDADLVIHAPERSSIEVSGVSSDIEVTDIRGEQSLESVSGDVEAVGVESDIEAASVSASLPIPLTSMSPLTEDASKSLSTPTASTSPLTDSNDCSPRMSVTSISELTPDTSMELRSGA